jgi:hypothetical protein
MAKAPSTSDAIMAPEKMKPLLALSKREPVQAAIGLTSDGDGIILLDKKAKPKKVFSLLKAGAAKAKIQLNTASLRFGRAEVDTDYDAGMVRFFVNKEAPGNMRAKLVEVVKRIPYQKVEINVDPSLEAEPEDDLPGQTEGAVGTAPVAAKTTVAPPPEAPPPPLDAATLKRDLAGLIGRIAQVAGDDAVRKVQLVQLATDANGAFKANNLEATAQSIARLREAIDNVGGGASTVGTPDGVHAVDYSKARADWLGARKQVADDLEALQAALEARYGDDPAGKEIVSAYNSKVAPVLAALDTSLADKLDEASKAANPAARERLAAEARQIAGTYEEYLASEPLITDLDANPFAPLAIRQTVAATLAGFAATFRT